MKFKVGDIIAANKDYGHCFTEGLIKGKVNYVVRDSRIIVVEILEHEAPYYIGKEMAYINEGDAFKLYEEPEVPESIVFKTKNLNAVVYRNGRRTIAKDKDTGKYAVALCSPEDTYDFMTGATTAMSRLIMEKLPPLKPLTTEEKLAIEAFVSSPFPKLRFRENKNN